MKKGIFLVIFWCVSACFLLCGCAGSKWVWCTSNGIVTYNGQTKQFEMIWENTAKEVGTVHDTVYVSSASYITTDSVRH